MVQKVELSHAKHVEAYGNPAPLGLLGLAVGCAALAPFGFGYMPAAEHLPAALRTAAVFALLFGAGCQLLAGYMEMANRNTFGGVIFTLFSFNWMVNAWELNGMASGAMPDHVVKLAVDVALLLILTPLTFGFGFFSKLLFAFLVDIDLLYVCKIAKALTGTAALNLPIGLLTVVLGGIGMWIGLAALINPVAGRQVFRVAGPLFMAPKSKRGFDWSVRHTIFDVLYAHWRENAFAEMDIADLNVQVGQKALKPSVVLDLAPDLFYLWDFGYLAMSLDGTDQIKSVRLNAQGIDLYEQVVLHKYDV